MFKVFYRKTFVFLIPSLILRLDKVLVRNLPHSKVQHTILNKVKSCVLQSKHKRLTNNFFVSLLCCLISLKICTIVNCFCNYVLRGLIFGKPRSLYKSDKEDCRAEAPVKAHCKPHAVHALIKYVCKEVRASHSENPHRGN